MHFCVVCCVSLLNIGRNGESKKMIDKLTFQVVDTVTGTCLNSTFSNYLLIDIWCNISKSVNHVSDQGSNVSGLMCKL